MNDKTEDWPPALTTPPGRPAHRPGDAHGTRTAARDRITRGRAGISFDCGNELHAPVCPGCGCECHR